VSVGKEEIVQLLEGVLNDRGVPKNVKSSIEEAISILRDRNANNVKIAETASILEEVSNDPNVSVYTRTVLWDVVSRLEALK
jgi:uncharacterized protein (UPF0147 family)